MRRRFAPDNPQFVFQVVILELFSMQTTCLDSHDHSVSEFQQHKKLSPTRDEDILHTRKGKFSQIFEMVMLLIPILCLLDGTHV